MATPKDKKPDTSGIKEGVDYDSLGLGGEYEEGRDELMECNALQLTRFRIDTKTRFYNHQTKEGGILKFDGFDSTTKKPVKYRTTGKTMISQFMRLLEKVTGYEQVDEKGIVWIYFKIPVNIAGIEAVPVDHPVSAPVGAVGQWNPYFKIKSSFKNG